MIVECAGLPGAGKTTICGHVSVPHGRKGAVPLSSLRIDRAWLRAASDILLLSLSAHPFSFDRMKRGFNLLVFLRHYQPRRQTVLLDQGLVQKLWSLLFDATFSPARLNSVLRNLHFFAPDHLVWIATPVDLAARRIAERRHGYSRFDGLTPQDAEIRLADTAELLEQLVTRFAAATGVTVLELDGALVPEANAARIDALLAGANLAPSRRST